MSTELLEERVEVMDEKLEQKYDRYAELGGKIMSKEDFKTALEMLASNIFDKKYIGAAKIIADFADITPTDDEIFLYCILRLEKLESLKYDYSDQQRFMEAVRMLGDAEAVEKMTKAHPQMDFNFKYEKAA